MLLASHNFCNVHAVAGTSSDEYAYRVGSGPYKLHPLHTRLKPLPLNVPTKNNPLIIAVCTCSVMAAATLIYFNNYCQSPLSEY